MSKNEGVNTFSLFLFLCHVGEILVLRTREKACFTTRQSSLLRSRLLDVTQDGCEGDYPAIPPVVPIDFTEQQ